jgi:hypothetical protein
MSNCIITFHILAYIVYLKSDFSWVGKNQFVGGGQKGGLGSICPPSLKKALAFKEALIH